jgi:hypothetical protein
MVPLEGMGNRTPDLPLCDSLPLVGCLGQPTDARIALLLSFEYPPSAASCLSPALDGSSDVSLLTDFLKRPLDVCICLVEDQKLS